MENKINIAELLKDCPKGMELDCTMYDNLYFDEVDTIGDIKCYIKSEYGCLTRVTFYENGCYSTISNAKCVIFPKGKATWEGFVPPCKFKDGDVLAEDSCIFIIQKIGDNCTAAKTYCTLYNDGDFDDGSILYFDIDSTKLATEEEKAKLFQAIKDNGYFWNTETKTLEKLIKPKFKVGDEIVKRNSISNSWIVSSVSFEYYGLKLPNGIEGIGVLPVSEQDDWELLPNIKPKFKVGDKVRHKNNHNVVFTITNIEDDYYARGGKMAFSFDDQDNYELVPNKFDINTLKPLQPVLVRDTNAQVWTMDLFSHKIDTNKRLRISFSCVGHYPNQCIPYEGNEHLLGKTDDCDDFYKTW